MASGDAEDGDDDDDLMDETVGEGEGEDSVRRAAAAAQINQQEKETEDREFPDEVDTPIDIPAFKRFSRYRSLQNMRNAEWNPKENLPVDYGRIFQVCVNFELHFIVADERDRIGYIFLCVTQHYSLLLVGRFARRSSSRETERARARSSSM